MTPKPFTKNTLLYGDNLPILREYIPDESVDLIYLERPSSQNPYKVNISHTLSEGKQVASEDKTK